MERFSGMLSSPLGEKSARPLLLLRRVGIETAPGEGAVIIGALKRSPPLPLGRGEPSHALSS